MAARKVRYTIDLTEELNAEIEAMARDAGMTKSEIFRRALGLFKIADRARRQGEHLGIVDEDHNVKREIAL